MSYEDALAVFSALGRLTVHDHTGAIVLVNGKENAYTRGQIVAAAMIIARRQKWF